MREIETMTRTEIASLYQSPASFSGKKGFTVCGWVRTIRDSKALGFMELNDGSCFKGVQVVFEDKKIDNFKEIAKLNVGAAVTVNGEFVETPQAKQPFELHACEILVEGPSSPEYPLFFLHMKYPPKSVSRKTAIPQIADTSSSFPLATGKSPLIFPLWPFIA